MPILGEAGMEKKKFSKEEFKRRIRERYMMPEDIRKLIAENKDAIQTYNANFLPKLPMMGATAMLIALLVSFVHSAMAQSRPIYLVMYVACLIFFAITRGGRIKKHALLCLYGSAVVLFMTTLYLSVIKGATYPAAAYLIMLSVFPVLFIDRKVQMNCRVLVQNHLSFTIFFRSVMLFIKKT